MYLRLSGFLTKMQWSGLGACRVVFDLILEVLHYCNRGRNLLTLISCGQLPRTLAETTCQDQSGMCKEDERSALGLDGLLCLPLTFFDYYK
jgi:hypothetical protein